MRPNGAPHRTSAAVAALSLMLAGCGGGNGNSVPGTFPTPTPTPTATGARVYPTVQEASLSVTDVQQVIAQAVGEAQARNLPAVIAVTDRVGNVLAVFRMNGAKATMLTSTYNSEFKQQIANPVDAEGLTLPAEVGAIAKAVTAAYLSSGGNAFSTRTASEIVQQHFPPAPQTPGLESGPLFGVQFSQLPCSDLTARFQAGGGSIFRNPVTQTEDSSPGLIGPKRSPIGLSADPGGMPLYKNGVLVGAVGVMADGDYGFDPDVTDVDNDGEEYIALAGLQGFAPPDNITGDKITVDGTTLRFSDATVNNLAPLQTNFSAINNAAGTLIPVRGYNDGAIVAGTAYGTEASGFRYATTAEFDNPDAFVLTDGSGNDRFPIRAATDGGTNSRPLTKAEVREILTQAFKVMSRARAQIRRPLDSRAEVSISVVDTHGAVLGIVRAPDAPIFGIDVSLQKARTATFFSSPDAATALQGDPDQEIPDFVGRVRNFLGDQTALTGTKAFADRSGGNLSRPYFPDGQLGTANGPLSRPIAQFNPLATGLQFALVRSNVLAHAAYIGGAANDTAHQCTSIPIKASANGQQRLANGIQIFPGSVPIYRGTQLVGGIGVSGDGIDQDDMISFLGANNAGVSLGTLGNAPKDMRADTIVVPVGNGVRLRYVNCPFAPFLDSSDQNVCEGL
ncbi:heme-binding protein [Novosphingobium sp. ZN18A2]|uniref:heme-binding protein n=1 Tax=Novosphingobium sp. ZN18A2 TaxID=3079861 RepID=UPI0030CDE214